MILYLAYALIFIAILIAVKALYKVYCAISLKYFNKEVQDSTSSHIESKSRFNIFIAIIKRSRKVKDATSADELKKEVKKKVKAFTLYIIITVFIDIILAFQCFIYGVALESLNTQLQIVATSYNTIFKKEDGCQCYALCTGDSADDSKTAYEMIFGEEEYNKLVEQMTLTDAEYEQWYGKSRNKRALELVGQSDLETVDTPSDDTYLLNHIKVLSISDNGREKSEFIRDHINDDMVNTYRSLVANDNLFRFRDGRDRTKMQLHELKQDLYDLFTDYKENGRNPNCDCRTANTSLLPTVCYGEPHWKPGWTFSTKYWERLKDYLIPKPQEPQEPKDPKNTGAKNSAYGIKLDDGWYYWYQQSSCSCAHNVNHPTYGRYSSIILHHYNGNDADDSAAGRGCSSYATSMAISNALGMEVTPFDFLTNVLQQNLVAYKNTYEISGPTTRGVNYDGPVIMNMGALAKSAVEAYGSYGIKAEVIGQSKDVVDKYLDNGYYLVVSVNGPKQGTFTWYGGGGHFIVLRKHVKVDGGSNDLYYCLDSNINDAGAYERMTSGATWADLHGHLRNGSMLAIWGPGVQNPGGNYTLSIDDKELLSIFMTECGASESKAYGMLACYKAATDCGLSSYETVGLIGCAMCEGAPGLVQYGFRYTGYEKSSASKPFWADTIDKVTAGLNDHTSGSSNDNNRGSGTAQWTNGREVTYLKNVKKYVGSTPVDYKKLWKADYDTYVEELNGSYKPLITEMKNHNSSVESIVVYSMFRYEAGFGNYKNNDTIAFYKAIGEESRAKGGKYVFDQYLESRYSNALLVDAALRKHAK